MKLNKLIQCQLKCKSLINISYVKKDFSFSYPNGTSDDKKISFAIVGSGPGGFYSAKQILKKYPNFHIDLYEKLPHPYGLVRTGIAPDHQDAKHVEHDFSQLIKKDAGTGRVNFYGNVRIGENLSFEDLKENYSGIIFSYGASGENKLNLENEDVFGCFSSRNFVNWYNGHIEYAEKSDFMSRNFDLGDKELEDIVIIGNGNVAIDIARILSKSYNQLKPFDIPEKILEKLSRNRIKNIHIVARRGLVQSSFTVKEMRELSHMENVKIYVLREEIASSLNTNSETEMTDALTPSERRQFSRKLELIKSLNILDNEAQIEEIKNDSNFKSDPLKKNIFLRFLLTPAKIEVDKSNANVKKVKGIKFLRSYLEGKPNSQVSIVDKAADLTKKEFFFQTGLIFKSIGYRCSNIFPNFLGFDNKQHTILNESGVVFDNKKNLYDDIFTSGWVKRGTKGIVDSTLRDASDTVTSINFFLQNDKLRPKNPDTRGIINKLESQNVLIFNNEKWNLIDKIELERGAKLKKLREKIINLEEMKSLVK